MAGKGAYSLIQPPFPLHLCPRYADDYGRNYIRPFQFVTLKSNAEQYAHIAKWMQEGKVKAIIEQEFALEDAGKAFERLKSGRTRGKLVIKVAGE